MNILPPMSVLIFICKMDSKDFPKNWLISTYYLISSRKLFNQKGDFDEKLPFQQLAAALTLLMRSINVLQCSRWNSLTTLMTHNHDVAFFTTYFHSDQFGYAKHARAFRTQIGLNEKYVVKNATSWLCVTRVTLVGWLTNSTDCTWAQS